MHRFHRAVITFAVLGHRGKRADAADPNPYPADDVARKLLLATGNSFEATRDLLDEFDADLTRFGPGLISTGRQGAGVYINLDQAL